LRRSGLMPRRRKQNDDWWIGPVSQLAGLIVLASLFIPGVHQMLLSIGLLALIIFTLLIVGLFSFGIYRWMTREQRSRSTNENVFANSSPAQNHDSYAFKVSAPPLATPKPADFMEQLRSMDWFQFEKLVGHVYQKRGYSVTRRGGANPDGGIDLIVAKDGQRAAIQCKQWKTWNVGVKAIREFLGALKDANIQKGIFITVRGYTGDAKDLAQRHGIEIMDETGLNQLLKSTDARFDPTMLELLNDTRKFCPKCERKLVVRTAEKGSNRGGKFWGCSGYPQGCCFTMPID
jgi:Holliday junction resolvase-like predicted endonuclease